MRLDLFLKVSRLIKQRTQAKDACDAGAVKINGQQAKAGKDINLNDEIEIRFTGRRIKAVVKEVPRNKNVPKARASELIEIVLEEKINLFD